MHRFGLFFASVLLGTVTLSGSPHRTPWGDPDLQGIWTNQTPTPLERPDALAGKATFTEHEAAEFEKTSLDRLLTTFAKEVPISGELNGIWLETAKGKVPPGRSTSLIVDPPDGKIPYQPWAKARRDDVLEHHTNITKWEYVDPHTRCFLSGIPRMFYQGTVQILQPPGYVVVLQEFNHGTRIIPLDPRPHVGDNIKLWMGDSRGHWEGATLVVETTNLKFNHQSRFGVGYLNGLSDERLRVVERFTMTDANTLTYRALIEDPTVFVRPWTVELSMARTPGPLFEVACHEGNYGMANILSGHRAEERQLRR
jgi:hypothetical protein